ncbi:hypothetical protein F3N42_14525 [Marinihelvus fidelis]|uniref:Uncharacterized protein n=1 Tax=Marinihelvus fidelis TaxID=2613842 RepID=A0A5N0T8X6_9GAMM|nr:hypothetical protein [Marinihelvus fidelis]KAA9129749.1 hypothetical protein F3N42_14525 [Marinihelvus fidelis]
MIYYELVNLFGLDGGAYAMRMLSWSLTFGLMLFWMRKIKAPAVAFVLVLPLLTVALIQRPLIRPELLSYPLIVISVILYEHARQIINWRTMLPIILLMVVWTNYHSSIFGWVVFFGLFVDHGYRQLMDRASIPVWANWFIWGCIVLAMGFLNPNLTHIIIALLNFSDEWKTAIKEFEPPLKYFEFGYFPVLIFSALLSLLLSVHQRKIGYLAALIVFLKFAMTTSRLITPATIFCMAILAHMLSDLRLADATRQWKRSANALAGIVLVCCLVMTGVHTAKMSYAMATQDLNPEQYPNDLIAYMKRTGKQGKIFNEYQVGGYLLYNLSPESKVFIDGRTGMLYGLDLMNQYRQSKASAKALFETYEEYGFDFAVMLNTQSVLRNLYYIGFDLDFSDTDYSLFQPGSGRLSELGYVWAFPYCWNSSMKEGLSSELRTLDSQSSANSELRMLKTTITGYLGATSKLEFLESFSSNPNTPDSVIRFVNYRALEEGLGPVSLKVLSHLKKWDLKDYLALAMAFLVDGQTEAALETLSRLAGASSSEIEFNDLVVQLSLLQKINDEVGLYPNMKSHYDLLSNTVGDNSLSAKGLSLSVASMCNFRPN